MYVATRVAVSNRSLKIKLDACLVSQPNCLFVFPRMSAHTRITFSYQIDSILRVDFADYKILIFSLDFTAAILLLHKNKNINTEAILCIIM